jgi:hypothetical protein
MCINVSSYFDRNAVVLLLPTRAGCMQQVVFGDLNGRIGTALLAQRLCSGICTVSDTHHSARKANFSVYSDDTVFLLRSICRLSITGFPPRTRQTTSTT